MNRLAYKLRCVPRNLQELALSAVYISSDKERLLVPTSATERGINYKLGVISTGSILTTTHDSIHELWYDERRNGSKSVSIATKNDLKKVPKGTELNLLLRQEDFL